MDLLEDIWRLVRPHLRVAGGRPAWPFVPGRNRVVDPAAAVAVATTSKEICDELAGIAPFGLCLAAELRKRADIEALVRNLASNLAIQYLLVTGEEDRKAPLASVVAALWEEDSVADTEQVRGLASAIESRIGPDLAVARKQVACVPMLGREPFDKIMRRIGELAAHARRPDTGFIAPRRNRPGSTERVLAVKNANHETPRDKAGSFKVTTDGRAIVVEHYGSKDNLLRTIEGDNARDICTTLIRNGWVSKLDHAAYLGRALMQAEIALQHGAEGLDDGEAPDSVP